MVLFSCPFLAFFFFRSFYFLYFLVFIPFPIDLGLLYACVMIVLAGWLADLFSTPPPLNEPFDAEFEKGINT